MRIRRKLATTALLLSAVVFAASCQKSCGESSDTVDVPETTVSADDADAGDAGREPRLRTAFGLPLPPQVEFARDHGEVIEAHTTMTLDEVIEFYEGRLTDYELVRNENRLEIVGLRAYMPHARGQWIRRTRLTELWFFRPEEPEPKKLDLAGNEVAKPKPEPKPENYAVGAKKGTPVRTRLPNGELMAPGARWGEAYVPPEGSFYHQKRYRGNFGRPFGEWIPF